MTDHQSIKPFLAFQQDSFYQTFGVSAYGASETDSLNTPQSQSSHHCQFAILRRILLISEVLQVSCDPVAPRSEDSWSILGRNEERRKGRIRISPRRRRIGRKSTRIASRSQRWISLIYAANAALSLYASFSSNSILLKSGLSKRSEAMERSKNQERSIHKTERERAMKESFHQRLAHSGKVWRSRRWKKWKRDRESESEKENGNVGEGSLLSNLDEIHSIVVQYEIW